MATIATADVCDANAGLLKSGELRMLQPIFQIYGKSRAFCGPVVAVKVFDDNALVKEIPLNKGEGRVLVIDGEGSMNCALMGGNLAKLAEANGWAGILINGCIRDVDDINGCGIGVRALASLPRRPTKLRIGRKDVPVYVGGTWIQNGEWLCADGDGILVSKTQLAVPDAAYLHTLT